MILKNKIEFDDDLYCGGDLEINFIDAADETHYQWIDKDDAIQIIKHLEKVFGL